MSDAWETWKTPAWIWRNPKIRPGAMRDVLVCLLWHQGTKGIAWPKIATLATETGHGASTVRAALKDLERLGFVQVIERRQAQAQGSVYRVIEHALAPEPPPEPDDETRENPRQILAGVESESGETRENPRQILAGVESETREKPRQISAHPRQISAHPPLESSGPLRQISAHPPLESSALGEPDQRTGSVERDQGTETRAPAPARRPVEASVWSSARLRVLLMELVARVIGTQPTIEGGQKLRIDAYFARTDREVTERDLAAFEAWLRLQPETRARSMPHGFVFADQTPGTWPDKLAEAHKLAEARGKRRGPATPGSIEEFDRESERLDRLKREGLLDEPPADAERKAAAL